MSFREKYARIERHYERLERPLGRYFYSLRRMAISFVERSRVFEIGVGVGKTLRYYPKNVELCGVDAFTETIEISRKKAQRLDFKACFMVADAEELSFPDESFGTVVSPFIFCTIPNPEREMREIRRVLKPGEGIFLEHTRNNSRILDYLFLAPLQLVLKPLLDDDPLRETHKLVDLFFDVDLEEDYYGEIVRLVVARKPG